MIILILVALNVLFAWLNNQERLAHIRAGNRAQVDHTLWTGVYLASLGVVFLTLAHGNITIVAAGIFMHGVIFDGAFNAFEGTVILNLSKTSASKLNQLYVRIGLKSMLIPYIVYLILATVCLLLPIKL